MVICSEAQTQETVSDWIISNLADRLGLARHEIDVHRELSEYGLTSVDAVNLSGELEHQMGQRLSPTLLLDYPTVDSLVRHLITDTVMTPPHQSFTPASDVDATLDSIGGQAIVPNGDIPPEYYSFELDPQYRQLQKRLQDVQSLGVENPYFTIHEQGEKNATDVNHRTLINYSTYNYLGMTGDPDISQAAKDAIDRYGTSVSASRVASGERPFHCDLEQELADFVGTEDCIVYVGGHATNVTTIGHLFGSQDLILYDALSHNSIVQGCILSGASAIAFPHNDWQALEQILAGQRRRYQRVLIVIEGVYSMDGDIPELPQFIAIKKRFKTFLMVDEAHSIGVLGQQGRGIGEYFSVEPTDVDLWMGSLSKSFASCGGYIAGSRALVEYLKYTAPGFVYSVGISPPNAAATLAAIKKLQVEPEKVSRLQARSRFFLKLANEQGLDTGMSHDSAVIPIMVGDSVKSLQLSQMLLKMGINVQPMFYPAVPKGTARLRFFMSCQHTESDIRFTVESIVKALTHLSETSITY